MVGTTSFVQKGSITDNYQQHNEDEDDGPELVVNNGRDLIEKYIVYASETESPVTYHRWSLVTGIGALIGRNMYIQHGHFRVFPNTYTMLIGPSFTRKSSAIKLARRLIEETGYAYFSAEKTSKEKFLLDLEGVEIDGNAENENQIYSRKKSYDSTTATNLWGDDSSTKEPREVFVCADEFNEFAGTSNLEFYTTLGNFWDWDHPSTSYSSRLKNSRSVSIFQPTVSLLGGNTSANFAKAFPAESLGLGFISRIIFVHGSKPGKKYAFPPIPNEQLAASIVSQLSTVRDTPYIGAIHITPNAVEFLEVIYEKWKSIVDPRFYGYNTRRFTQLLKLCIVSMVSMGRQEVTTDIVMYANTQLCAVELLMPRALGEFGKGQNSDIHDKVVNILDNAVKPMLFKEIFALVHNDLDKITSLSEILQSLTAAGKLQVIPPGGYLPLRRPILAPDFCDWSLLTETERQELVI